MIYKKAIIVTNDNPHTRVLLDKEIADQWSNALKGDVNHPFSRKKNLRLSFVE